MPRLVQRWSQVECRWTQATAWVALQPSFLLELVVVAVVADSMLVVRAREMGLESLLELRELVPRRLSSFLTGAVAVRILEEEILLVVGVRSQ